VAFGNSYNDEERCVLAGYDNGDVKMFDLRMNKVCGMDRSRRQWLSYSAEQRDAGHVEKGMRRKY